MAIEYSILMKDKKLTKEILIKKLEQIGYIDYCISELPEGIVIDLHEKFGVFIYLMDARSYPYNSWETSFCKNEYIFEKILEFRFLKDFDDWKKRYEIMFSIIFDLILELKEEALFVSNGDTELCMFDKEGKIYLNNKSKIWDYEFIKNMIIDKNIEYITSI